MASVEQLDKNGRAILTFPSIKAAAAAVGLATGTPISGVLSGTRTTAGGYKWRRIGNGRFSKTQKMLPVPKKQRTGDLGGGSSGAASQRTGEPGVANVRREPKASGAGPTNLTVMRPTALSNTPVSEFHDTAAKNATINAEILPYEAVISDELGKRLHSFKSVLPVSFEAENQPPIDCAIKK